MSGRKGILFCIGAIAGMAALFFGKWFLVSQFKVLQSPCRILLDCREQETTIESLQLIEEQEKEGVTGLIGITAWRYGETTTVTEPLSGKKETAAIIEAYGNLSQVFPVKVLSGNTGQAIGESDCILTKELSYALFGAVDTMGCSVQLNGKNYEVAAVIDKKGMLVLLPVESGTVEQAAFLFEDGKRIKEKMEALGMAYQ